MKRKIAFALRGQEMHLSQGDECSGRTAPAQEDRHYEAFSRACGRAELCVLTHRHEQLHCLMEGGQAPAPGAGMLPVPAASSVPWTRGSTQSPRDTRVGGRPGTPVPTASQLRSRSR